MPQIHLEYTSNILEENITELLTQIHEVLATTLPTKIHSCKSRAIKLDNYLVGEGKDTSAFVYCSIRILAGRSDAVINDAAEKVKALLTQHFSESRKKLDLQISLEMANLNVHYFKF